MTNHHHNERRIAYYRERSLNAWSRGFCVGFVTACIIVAVFLYGQRNAYGNERPAPRAAHHAVFPPAGVPPHWRTFLRIGMCEQPKPGYDWPDAKTDRQRWHRINWHSAGSRFPGGLGFTPLSWRIFRRHSDRDIPTMNLASPVAQLWAAERLWRWAEKTYPGAGYTAWECSRHIGWTTSDPNDALR